MDSSDSLLTPEEAAARARYERNELLAISRALSSERDIRKLLDLILHKSRQITGADAGSVYVVESDEPNGSGQGGGRETTRRRMTALGGDRGGKANLHFM